MTLRIHQLAFLAVAFQLFIGFGLEAKSITWLEPQFKAATKDRLKWHTDCKDAYILMNDPELSREERSEYRKEFETLVQGEGFRKLQYFFAASHVHPETAAECETVVSADVKPFKDGRGCLGFNWTVGKLLAPFRSSDDAGVKEVAIRSVKEAGDLDDDERDLRLEMIKRMPREVWDVTYTTRVYRDLESAAVIQQHSPNSKRDLISAQRMEMAINSACSGRRKLENLTSYWISAVASYWLNYKVSSLGEARRLGRGSEMTIELLLPVSNSAGALNGRPYTQSRVDIPPDIAGLFVRIPGGEDGPVSVVKEFAKQAIATASSTALLKGVSAVMSGGRGSESLKADKLDRMERLNNFFDKHEIGELEEFGLVRVKPGDSAEN